MITRSLGTHGPEISAIGLGCGGISDGTADEAESLATIHTAIEYGITLLDTADFYGMGHNEMLLRKALRGRTREQIVISDKFGALRDPEGRFIGIDSRPASVKSFLAYTLRRLGTDYIDIYRPARLDPTVPIEETIGAIADMVKAGYVRFIGLSEVGSDTIRRAQAVHPISDVQLEYSLFSRGIESTILPTCRELGIGITAYGVLSHGLLSGQWSKERAHVPGSFTNFSPRFKGTNLDHNLALVEALRSLAEAKGVTVSQMAIAWVLTRGQNIVPLVGASRRESLGKSLKALSLQLTADDIAQIEQAIPKGTAAGERYPAPLMALLDSERDREQNQ
ncbi:aldo/keto reductase [Ktedonospora formicarum]|uniref:Aldo/keto reductase n=1 Tax=Ktedonospora formicarum TaxID=2778364 RepID=A0A8J3HU46_9CHLR|nr:aldo/keto reductase [Ktedonospora formicarum]GHO42016.1 aldo/keto reductase [Ktedonospora formicarum]